MQQRLNLMPQRAKNTLINFMWYRKAGLLRIFPLFSPETNKLGWTVYPQQNTKNSMKEDLIDIIIAPSFIRESENRAAKHISGWISSPPRASSPKRSKKTNNKKTNRLSMLLILNPTNFGGFSHYSREKCVLACINKARQQLKTYSQRRCFLWDNTIAIYFIIVSIYLLTDWPPH